MIFDSAFIASPARRLRWPKGLDGPTKINPRLTKIFHIGDVNVKKRRGVLPFCFFPAERPAASPIVSRLNPRLTLVAGLVQHACARSEHPRSRKGQRPRQKTCR
jgi:hypothetical protein